MKQININETDGKTVRGMANNDSELITVFTDETYVIFRAQSGYDGCDASITETELDLTGFGDADLVRLGVITQSALDAIRKARKDKFEADLLERKKQQLARLQKELGVI